MTAAQTRIKLHFEGALGQCLAHQGLDKCWYSLQAKQKTQTVADLVSELQKAFSLLGEQSDLHFQLDGYTVLSSSPLSFFRDGDVVIIRIKPQEQQLQPLALVDGAKTRKRVSVIRGDDSDSDPKPAAKKKAATHQASASEAAIAKSPLPAKTSRANAATEAQPKPDKAKKKRKREAEQPAGPEAAVEADAADVEAGAAADAAADETEDKKPSRSARRKALKRKCRRLGLSPPQAPAASSAAAASVSAALAAAAAASPFDPNGVQPHQGTLAQPEAKGGSPEMPQPSAKRLKTQPFRVQPVTCEPVKSYKGADGHVYFAASSDSDSDPNMHMPLFGDAADALDEQELQAADSHGGSRHQAAAEAAVESVHGRQDANKSTGKSTDTAKPGSSDQGAGSKQPLPQQAASAHVALPMTDAENAALPAVEGLPVTGDLVAYKLLEIGFDWTPQVSEWRHGEVSFDQAGSVVIKPTFEHSSTATAAADNGNEEQEEEEGQDDEGPPSNYDEEGILTTDRGSLTELRLIRAFPSRVALQQGTAKTLQQGAAKPLQQIQSHQAPAGTPSDTAGDAAAASQASKAAAGLTSVAGGPSQSLRPSNSQTGGARDRTGNLDGAAEPKRGPLQAELQQNGKVNTVPKVGAWAELQDQLQRRRAELGSSATRNTPSSESGLHQPNGVHATAADKASAAARTNMRASSRHDENIFAMTPAKVGNEAVPTVPLRGAVRPRGGVRASAMGPLLNFLRTSGGLTGET